MAHCIFLIKPFKLNINYSHTSRRPHLHKQIHLHQHNLFSRKFHIFINPLIYISGHQGVRKFHTYRMTIYDPQILATPKFYYQSNTVTEIRQIPDTTILCNTYCAVTQSSSEVQRCYNTRYDTTLSVQEIRLDCF